MENRTQILLISWSRVRSSRSDAHSKSIQAPVKVAEPRDLR